MTFDVDKYQNILDFYQQKVKVDDSEIKYKCIYHSEEYYSFIAELVNRFVRFNKAMVETVDLLTPIDSFDHELVGTVEILHDLYSFIQTIEKDFDDFQINIENDKGRFYWFHAFIGRLIYLSYICGRPHYLDNEKLSYLIKFYMDYACCKNS